MAKKILITGGTGYIGSHTCLALLESGFRAVIVDNLANSSLEALSRIEKLSGRAIPFYRVDIGDEAALDQVFKKEKPDAVIHFAGLKAVGESTRMPLEYYRNNVGGSLSLLRVMQTSGVRDIVFSSSATVYGDNERVPFREDYPITAANPYGRTKIMVENILRDLAAADAAWNIAILRYFNPIGAHESGMLGEDPFGEPNNLAPIVSRAAIGRSPGVKVFGGDYPTPDGTGVRDFIHVMDLAAGHVAVLEKLFLKSGLVVYNLGTGRGHSVLEVIRMFEEVSGRPIAYEIVERRPGDVATCYADVSKARRELGWEARRDLRAMVEDGWRWQSRNPNGYEKGADQG